MLYCVETLSDILFRVMLVFLMINLVTVNVLVSGLNHGSPRYACEHPQGDSCFYVLDEAKNQSEAERVCGESNGGHLATVSDMSSMEYLKYLLTSTHTEVAWIGAHYSKSLPPENVKCGVMAVSETGRATWTTRKCSNEGKYTCIYKRDSHTRPCRYEFLTCGNYCLRRYNHVFGHPQELDWYRAKRTCFEFGANLPTIKSLGEAQTWVNNSCYNTARSQSPRTAFDTWTEFTNIQWRWTTGQKVEYTAWHPSYPVPEAGKCVKISKESMGSFLWKNEPCTTRIPAICQIPYPPYSRSESGKAESTREEPSSHEKKKTQAPSTIKPTTSSQTNTPKASVPTTPPTTTDMITESPEMVPHWRRDKGGQGGDGSKEHLGRPDFGKPKPTPRPRPSSRPPPNRLPVLYIAVSVGVCLVLLLVIIIIILCWRRRLSNCSNNSSSNSLQKQPEPETAPVRRAIEQTEHNSYSTMIEGPRPKCSSGNVYEGLDNVAFDGTSRHEYEMLSEDDNFQDGIKGPLQANGGQGNTRQPLPKVDPMRRNMRLPSLPHGGNNSNDNHTSRVKGTASKPATQTEQSDPTSAYDDQWQYLEVIAPPTEEGREQGEEGTQIQPVNSGGGAKTDSGTNHNTKGNHDKISTK